MTKSEIISKIADLKTQITEKQKEIDNFEYISSESDYDDYLEDIYGNCNIAGGTYSVSYALKLVDETAYNTGKNDYDGSIDLDTIPEYKELQEELEEMENEIDDLELELLDLELEEE